MWKLHLKIAAPAMVYQQETVQVHECAAMASTGIFQVPVSRTEHLLNTKLEDNNFTCTVMGSLTYEGRHSLQRNGDKYQQ